jgi:4'-phosphopantetheinyl transferase
VTEADTRFSGWREPPAELVLRPAEVHIWLLLDSALATAATQQDVLAADERARASRLDAARSRSYIGTRATLRMLLSRYTSAAPEGIVFSYGPLGKPAYEPGGVHFSISHAGDRALLAFARSGAVGVDLERVKAARRFDALSARFFSDANARTIARASPSAVPRIFTEAWAEREAYVKAVGGGLYATADALPFTPGRIPVRRVLSPTQELWTIATLEAGADFEAKLVAQGEPASLSYFTIADNHPAPR